MDEPDQNAFAGRGRFAMRPSDRRRQDRDVKQRPAPERSVPRHRHVLDGSTAPCAPLFVSGAEVVNRWPIVSSACRSHKSSYGWRELRSENKGQIARIRELRLFSCPETLASAVLPVLTCIAPPRR